MHFASGQFQPETKSGKELIGHEFAHVVQQRQGKVQTNKQIGKYNINDNSALEKEADNVGIKFANSQQINFNTTINSSDNKVMPFQMAFKKGIIINTAHFHKVKAGKADLGGRFSSGNVGKKLKSGDTVNNVDFSEKVDGFYKAKDQKDNPAFIRETSVIDADSLREKREEVANLDNDEFGKSNARKMDDVSDVASNESSITGGYQAVVAGGNTETVNGMVVRKSSSDIDSGTDRHSAGWGVASSVGGGLSDILGMISSVKSFKNESGWKRFEAGATFIAETANVVSSGSALLDNMAKALGHSDGLGEAGIVSKYAGSVAGAITTVQNAVKGVTGLFKLYNSKSNTKGSDALVSFQMITKAALSAAGVAKTAYLIIGNGIPTSLLATIPAISIAVSAIDLIIRFADAVIAGQSKNTMIKESDVKRKILGRELESKENTTKNSHAFSVTRRGTFPVYKSYYRVKKEIVNAIDSSVISARAAEVQYKIDQGGNDTHTFTGINSRINTAVGNISETDRKLQIEKQNLIEVNQKISILEQKRINSKINSLITEGLDIDNQKLTKEKKKRTAIQQKIDSYNTQKGQQTDDKNTATRDRTNLNNLVKLAIANTIDAQSPDIMPDVKLKLRAIVNNPTDIPKLEALSFKIRNYEFVDKMSEINQKRQVGGWTDVGYDLVNITADILALSGVASVVGISLKAAVAGTKMAHSGAKFGQKLYRDRGDGLGEKSTKTKHAEYVKHTKFIFELMSKITTQPNDWEKGGDEEKQIMGYLKATGVNTGLLFAINGKPEKQAEMIVSAMKKRS